MARHGPVFSVNYLRFAGSAVGVARPAATADSASPTPPRRQLRTHDVNTHDGAVPKVFVEAPDHGRREQPELGRPGGRVGSHGDAAVLEALRIAVGRHVASHNEGPATEHPVHSDIGAPAAVENQPVKGVAQRCRVSLVRMRT